MYTNSSVISVFITIIKKCDVLEKMAEKSRKSRKPTPLTISAQSGTPSESTDSGTSDLQQPVTSSSAAELVDIVLYKGGHIMMGGVYS